MTESDRVVRAMTEDGAFRVIAARATDTVREVVGRQRAGGDAATRLGELVTGAVLYRETMAPSRRVQAIVQGANGSGHLVADSHPDGWARGLYQPRDADAGVALGGDGALLQMMRTLPNGTLHVGTVPIADAGNLSNALMTYMDQSEQVRSMVSVALTFDDDGAVRSAGGYLLQLLPEAPDAPGALAVMAERVRDFTDIAPLLDRTDAAPGPLVEELLHRMPFEWLHESPLRFGCHCSRERVVASLRTLDPAELEAVFAEQDPVEMRCDYCATLYHVHRAEFG
ncbi:MAG: Hsp33 family molecular chaperone HslO [Myxococcales bacterium]|nr:Hsp33 family molecular chaperone HslO [Myxococcales bacterium]